jgi:tripartite-type tricarboxylate transporter receptor subunit TctC
MKSRFDSWLRPLALAALLAPVASGHAQSYPEKPIRLLLPYETGAFPDIVARLVGGKVGDAIGQRVLVENRVGASGSVGTLAVVKSPADGYTLLAVINNHATNPYLFKNLPYDRFSDLAPVSLMVRGPLVLAVNPKLGVSTLQEFVKLAKSKPGALNFATAGAGSPGRLLMEALKIDAGIDVTMVPYKGTAIALGELVGGQVDAIFAAVPSVNTHYKAGRVRVLAITSESRTSIVPGVPTVSETFPGLTGEAWMGLLAPAKTSPAIIDRLNAEVAKALALADVKARLAELGMDTVGGSPAQFDQYLRAESERWGRVIRAQKIEVEQ